MCFYFVASGYYSNAKFLSLAYNKMLDGMGDNANNVNVTFNGGRTLNVQQIYDNLLDSMDIAFRYFNDESTLNDLNHNLYNISIELFVNKPSETILFNGRNRGNILNEDDRLPDGSAIYGIVLHSRNLAVFGYGQFENFVGDGENVEIENVQISDLRIKTNEIPAIYFDECHDEFSLRTIVKGPFGDVMDIRKMVGFEDIDIIDNGDDYTLLSYIGNPLSDAQIALALFGDIYNATYNTNGQSIDSPHFLKWALDEFVVNDDDTKYDTLPSCAKFMCNGDIMLHTNKGLLGVRFDFIENVTISNLQIDRLINESPLSSFACSNYTGSHDGGNPNQFELEGSMSTDIKGIAVYGSNILFTDNQNSRIRQLISNNGDVVGIHIMSDSQVIFDDDSSIINIERLITGASITNEILLQLQDLNKTPYPNNFFSCNILLDDTESDIGVILQPNPPNGIAEILCIDGLTASITNEARANGRG